MDIIPEFKDGIWDPPSVQPGASYRGAESKRCISYLFMQTAALP